MSLQINFVGEIRNATRLADKYPDRPANLYSLRFSQYLSSKLDKKTGGKKAVYQKIFCSVYSNSVTESFLKSGRVVSVCGHISSISHSMYEGEMEINVNAFVYSIQEVRFPDHDKQLKHDDEIEEEKMKEGIEDLSHHHDVEEVPF